MWHSYIISHNLVNYGCTVPCIQKSQTLTVVTCIHLIRFKLEMPNHTYNLLELSLISFLCRFFFFSQSRLLFLNFNIFLFFFSHQLRRAPRQERGREKEIESKRRSERQRADGETEKETVDGESTKRWDLRERGCTRVVVLMCVSCEMGWQRHFMARQKRTDRCLLW